MCIRTVQYLREMEGWVGQLLENAGQAHVDLLLQIL